MLRESYHCGIVGLNYISLLYALITLKSDKTTLIVNDPELFLANKWLLNIGYVERSTLIQIGQKYDIDCLVNIDNYLIEENTILYMNEKLVELSNSPFINIKEMARKFPDSFSHVYIEKLESCDPEEFDERFFELLEKISENAMEDYLNGELDQIFKDCQDFELNDVLESFLNFLDEDKLVTKQLHYVLQVMFQTVFSSAKGNLESKFLLTSLISPRFRIDYETLQEELMLEFRKLGGDLIQTNIKDWGITDHRLKYWLLNTVDGVIQVDESFYFGKISELQPFESEDLGTEFLSISLECYIDHDFIEIFRNKRICFSGEKRMGSDFPYWEVYINEDGMLNAVYTFANYLGTKASFYYHHAIEDVFQSLQIMLPGIDKADFIARSKLSRGSDIWFEYSPEQKALLHPHHKHDFSQFYHKVDTQVLKGIKLCGPKRSRSLGLFSYLLDIIL